MKKNNKNLSHFLKKKRKLITVKTMKFYYKDKFYKLKSKNSNKKCYKHIK